MPPTPQPSSVNAMVSPMWNAGSPASGCSWPRATPTVRISAYVSNPSNNQPRLAAISVRHCDRSSDRYHGSTGLTCASVIEGSYVVPRSRTETAFSARVTTQLTTNPSTPVIVSNPYTYADRKLDCAAPSNAPRPSTRVTISTSNVMINASGAATRMPSSTAGSRAGASTLIVRSRRDNPSERDMSSSTGGNDRRAVRQVSRIGQVAGRTTTTIFIAVV